MEKIWIKTLNSRNKIISESVYENADEININNFIDNSMEDFCKKADIPNPVWLLKNKKTLSRSNITSFDSNNFLEEIEFSKLVLEIFYERK